MRIRIRDPVIFLTLDVGSGTEKILIRDKHHGSATLVLNDDLNYPTHIGPSGGVEAELRGHQAGSGEVGGRHKHQDGGHRHQDGGGENRAWHLHLHPR
jgi:hypothetical protein